MPGLCKTIDSQQPKLKHLSQQNSPKTLNPKPEYSWSTEARSPVTSGEGYQARLQSSENRASKHFGIGLGFRL